jgi:hypothetical protein
MDREENKELINRVEFTKNAIIIGGVAREYENLKKDDPRLQSLELTYTPYEKTTSEDTPQIYKGEGIYVNEDYFNFAMVEQLHITRKVKLPTKEDMEKTLKALPGGGCNIWGKGSAKLFAILTGCQESGCRSDESRKNRGYGSLWSVSSHGFKGA